MAEIWNVGWNIGPRSPGAGDSGVGQTSGWSSTFSEHLGAGFIRHPKNKQLVQKLESGELPGLVFYGQLLRLVYRLLFLCVAEDRDLLHPQESEETGRQYYHDFFSLT